MNNCSIETKSVKGEAWCRIRNASKYYQIFHRDKELALAKREAYIKLVEYLDYCWNFMTGCTNYQKPYICGGDKDFECWAKAMAKRFGRNFTPRFNDKLLYDMPTFPKEPSRIGICFTGDLFCDYWFADTVRRHEWDCAGDTAEAFIQAYNEHKFFFLTKCPWNLKEWGEFPDNAWVGVSVTKSEMLINALYHLKQVEAKHKWLSFEPLMERIPLTANPKAKYPITFQGCIDWIVIGGLSNKPMSQQPKEKWVREIVDAAHQSNIPVFIKDNIRAYRKLAEVSK